MNALLAIPLPIRLVVLFVVGALLGRLIDTAARRLVVLGAWPPGTERTGAVTGAHRGNRTAARTWSVQLFTGALLAGLYWWEIGRLALLPPIQGPVPLNLVPFWANLHGQFAAHVVLIALMLLASLVDLEEKIIPDAITVPGTLVGLAAAAAYPWILLPTGVVFVPGGLVELEFLQLNSPNDYPALLEGFPRVASLLLGLACIAAWCFALLPRRWYGRHGWRRAAAVMLARVVRERVSWQILWIGVAGSAVIVVVWLSAGPRWQGLLSSLVGMAVGGGIIWAVRLIGAVVLRREAMGFGDVTLLAMIGAYTGWQTCLLIFFLAPVMGLVLGIAQLIINREAEIPYGPFLCLAALAIVVLWSDVWQRAADVFQLGWLVPVAMIVCLVLMGVLLGTWRLLLSLLQRGGKA